MSMNCGCGIVAPNRPTMTTKPWVIDENPNKGNPWITGRPWIIGNPWTIRRPWVIDENPPCDFPRIIDITRGEKNLPHIETIPPIVGTCDGPDNGGFTGTMYPDKDFKPHVCYMA